jgi:hypothetical protein
VGSLRPPQLAQRNKNDLCALGSIFSAKMPAHLPQSKFVEPPPRKYGPRSTLSRIRTAFVSVDATIFRIRLFMGRQNVLVAAKPKIEISIFRGQHVTLLARTIRARLVSRIMQSENIQSLQGEPSFFRVAMSCDPKSQLRHCSEN